MQAQNIDEWRPAAFFHGRYQVSSTTWWRLSKNEGFPTPIRIGRRVRWNVAECDSYILSNRS